MQNSLILLKNRGTRFLENVALDERNFFDQVFYQFFHRMIVDNSSRISNEALE